MSQTLTHTDHFPTDNSFAPLVALTLYVATSAHTWAPVTFEGDSAAHVDAQAARYLAAHPEYTVSFDESSTCFSQFPKTFNRVYNLVTV